MKSRSPIYADQRRTDSLRLIPFAVAVCLVATSCSSAFAQEQPNAGYVLHRVSTGTIKGRDYKGPQKLYANHQGGSVVVQMRAGEDCTEMVTFKWTFDQDITFLKAGQQFKVNFEVISTDCKRNDSNHSGNARGGGSNVMPEILQKLESDVRGLFTDANGMYMAPNPREVYGKQKKGATPYRTGSFRATAPDKPPEDGTWLTINLGTDSRNSGSLLDKICQIQVAYLYKGVASATPPESITFTLDNPPEAQNSVVTVTPGGGSGTPPTPPPDGSVPCLDPAVQKCIDEWVAMATKLKNERQPELGPWTTSKWGHWVNRNIIQTAQPDGWVEKYHSSRYCFLWEVAAPEHLDPVYNNDLPPLHEYVRDCVKDATGATIDIPPAPTRPPSPPGTDPNDPPGMSPPNGGYPPAAGGKLGNLNLTITYPTDMLQLANSQGGDVPSSTLFEFNTEPAGTIRVGLADQKGVVGDFSLCRLDFELIGQPGDVAPLIGNVTLANRTDNQVVKFLVINGEIRILKDSTPGDFDGNGTIDSLDALAALRMSIGKLPEQLILDVDSDGKVTAKDARLIMGMAVGINPTPGGSTSPTTPSTVIQQPPAGSGPTITIGSAAKKAGETVLIPVFLHYLRINQSRRAILSHSARFGGQRE